MTADLRELFDQRTADKGVRYARRRYYHDVFSLWFVAPTRERRNRESKDQRWPSGSLRDATYAMRMFRRRPVPVIIAVVGLGASLGLCGAVFSILNAATFKSFGMDDPSTVARIWKTRDADTWNTYPYDEYLRLRAAAKQISLGAYLQERAQLEEQPDSATSSPVSVSFVNGNFFRDLGGRAFRGRALSTADDAASAPAVAVISYNYWKKRFRSDESAVGRTVWLSGSPFTIVGVTEQGFTGSSDTAPAFWAPLGVYGQAFRTQTAFAAGARVQVQVFGRLAPGVSRDQASEELTAVLRGMAAETKTVERPYTVRAVGVDEHPGGPGDGALTAIVLTIIVVSVALLLAGANVANLLLASAAAREREMKLRLALGASRARLVRQLLTESLLLALASGAIGLLLTMWSVPILAAVVELPPTVDASADVRVYLFLAAISGLVGIGAGLAPAFRGTGAALVRLRSDASRPVMQVTGRRFRSLLLGAQTAASLVVLILAMLMGKAAVRAAAVDPGFDAGHLITVAPAFGRARYGDAEVAAYWDAARSRLRALPSVERTALILHPPFSGGSILQLAELDGRRYTIFYNYTTQDYFETIGLRLLRGRIYTADEVRTGARVAVISQRLAQDHWPSQEPIGSTLERVHRDMAGVEVIGVVSDAITARLREYQTSALYRPLSAAQSGEAQLVVRTRNPPSDLRAVADIVRGLDPELRSSATLTSEGLDEERREPATIAMLAGIAAALAVSLSLVGLIGATLHHVGLRTHEIGVRIAIGASSGDVLGLLLRDALRPVGIGLVAGLTLALLGGRTIANVIFGVSPTDAASIGLALALLSGSAFLAVIFPTRRASRTDPARALRES